ncbi:unnamed protein product [Notodromas monacha]|uniref:Uncharacterized protein n=1 Tax=Notodromas monacha TaxID=399045 RepID=A0A7R9GFR9_9CRUS|nr:unnamed protein product [Notodromas monacha]CAG0921061.1 unnamed protein product [Notodromas monacha]
MQPGSGYPEAATDQLQDAAARGRPQGVGGRQPHRTVAHSAWNKVEISVMFKKSAPAIPPSTEPPTEEEMMEDILKGDVDAQREFELSDDDVSEVGADLTESLDDPPEEQLLSAALGAPSRRLAFKAVVNLIEAYEELQRSVPASKRETPAYEAYQQRIFEVMQECLHQLSKTRCLVDDVSWYQQLVKNSEAREQ